MRIVIDTNVLVSAFLSKRGAPAQLLAQLEQDAFVLLVSEPILDEYERALNYKKVSDLHGMSPVEVAEAVDNLRATAVTVEPAEPLRVVESDPDDDKFFECAVAGGAAYLISGDTHVRAIGAFQGIQVVSAPLFLEILKQGLA